MHLHRPHWLSRRLLRIGTALLLCLLAGLASPPSPSAAGDRADISVTIRSDPNMQVVAGSSMLYEVRVKNFGKGTAGQVRVAIPYDPALLSGMDADVPNRRDWVSKNERGLIELRFNDVRDGQQRTVRLRAQVAPTAARGTVIEVRGTYEWQDIEEWTRDQPTNLAPVLVSAENKAVPQIPLTVEPERGAACTNHRFSTNRLRPRESVSAWITTSDGTRDLGRSDVDGWGEYVLIFSSCGLEPGVYSLAVYGNRSELQGIGVFTVEAGSGAHRSE